MCYKLEFEWNRLKQPLHVNCIAPNSHDQHMTPIKSNPSFKSIAPITILRSFHYLSTSHEGTSLSLSPLFLSLSLPSHSISLSLSPFESNMSFSSNKKPSRSQNLLLITITREREQLLSLSMSSSNFDLGNHILCG